MTTNAVVTVTPTIQDGTVVRWFTSLADAEDCEPVVSASRNRVVQHRDPVPEAWLVAAEAVWKALRSNPDADMRHLATHRRNGFLGPLVSVQNGSGGER